MKEIRSNISIVVVLLLVSAFLFSSCRKNSPSWDTQILAPIADASLSINNIITSSYIQSNSLDSSVSLVYTDSLYNFNIDTLLTIPDTVLNYYQVTPIAYNVTPGQVIFATNPTTTTYPIGNAEVVKATLQSGFLIFTVHNTLNQPVDYLYKVVNVVKNGTDTLEVRVKVNATSTLTDKISLNGYNIDFTGPAHNSYNDITTSIQVKLDTNANPVTISAGTALMSATVNFEQAVPYYIKGYFSTTTKTFGPDKSAFPIFNKVIAGSLNLQNVNVNLSLVNGFGADARITLTQLSSYNSRTQTTINLADNEVINSAINVNRATPTNNPASPVSPTVTTFTINPSNSNILAWLDNLPTSIGYALQIETDPLGNISGSNDFAYYGHGITSAINVTVPLSLIANKLTLADTMAVSFPSSGSSSSQVESGTLTIYANNGFPFSAGLQVLLLGNNNVVTDSLFISSETIAAASVNATTGIVTRAESSVLRIPLDAKRTQELFNSKNIILHARFNMGSLPSTYRKIYSYYVLGLKLTGNFDFKVHG